MILLLGGIRLNYAVVLSGMVAAAAAAALLAVVGY